MASPTSRSLEALRKNGYTCQVVEKWNPYARIRQDLFGIIDILAIRDNDIVGVQTTTKGHMNDRKKKAMASTTLRPWLRSGGRFILHGWAKQGDRGCRKTWVLTEHEIVGR